MLLGKANSQSPHHLSAIQEREAKLSTTEDLKATSSTKPKIKQNFFSAKNLLISFALFISLVGLYFLSRYNYLLFHSTVEIFTIVIAIAIFTIAWNSRHIMDNNYLTLIGIAFLFVGVLDLIHTLAYKGMGVFPDVGSNLATQLWIATRYLFSLSLLGPLLFIKSKIKMLTTFTAYFTVTAFLILSIFYLRIFPQAYIDGIGLTAFKVASEYVISLILAISIAVLIKNRREFSDSVFKLLLAAMALGIATELAFTLYTDVYGIANFVGHLFNILSFYLIYKALVETGFSKPYDLLFRNLKQSEEHLEQYAAQMEKLAEERLSKLKDSERLAVIGATAGMVGHDIRNPLQAIVGDLFIARQEAEELNDSEAKKSLLETIDGLEENVFYINKIIADLQDYARPLNPRIQETDIKSVIEKALENNHCVPENIKTHVKVDADAEIILADEDFLKRIICNLVLNSVQAMPKGGTLTIRSFKDKQTDETVLTVGDTGVGISEDVKPKLFTPMTTTKAKGQGFGLAVVKRMTEGLGGTVTFESTEGKGTTFIVRIPQQRPKKQTDHKNPD